MKTEYLILNNRSERKQIEQICVIFPDICISVFPQTLIIKTVDLCDLSWLMISSEDSNSILEPDLDGHQESDSLHWVVASVDVISHK